MRVREPLDKNVRDTLDAKIAVELDEAYSDDVVSYLGKIAAALKRKGITINIVVLSGDPAEEIIKYSKLNGVDLIIMSTHGRSGFSRLMFGSVADEVIRQTEVPVLLRPAGQSATA